MITQRLRIWQLRDTKKREVISYQHSLKPYTTKQELCCLEHNLSTWSQLWSHHVNNYTSSVLITLILATHYEVLPIYAFETGISFLKTATQRYHLPHQVLQSSFQPPDTGPLWLWVEFAVWDGSYCSYRKWALHSIRSTPSPNLQSPRRHTKSKDGQDSRRNMKEREQKKNRVSASGIISL